MSDVPQIDLESYLGDGLYVRFDGFQIVLRAPRLGGDHFVALEPQVYQALIQWMDTYPRMQQHMVGG